MQYRDCLKYHTHIVLTMPNFIIESHIFVSFNNLPKKKLFENLVTYNKKAPIKTGAKFCIVNK